MDIFQSVRGSPRDIPIVLVTVFGISLFSIAMFVGVSEFDSTIQEMNETNNDLPMDTAAEFTSDVSGVFVLIDAGAIILTGVFFLGATYSALKVSSSKIFIIPSFLFLVASLYLAGILADTYFMIAETPALASYFNQFPATAVVMENLGIISGVLGMILLAATYFRNPTQTEVGI